MSTHLPTPEPADLGLLEDAVGYLNFSGGASDPKFQRASNALFARIEADCETCRPPVAILCDWFEKAITCLSSKSAAFGDVSQARAVIGLLRDNLLPAYRAFHHDLLWHQSEHELWRPLFLGRAFEAILSQGAPWNETERIVSGALESLNDYLGYRPVAVLESDRHMEPYHHERVCPIPLYAHDVGVAPGIYKDLLDRALAILAETDPDIRHQAWFDPQLVEELSLDPRAYDFDHPASKRPNHHFGQWDLQRVDNRGFYRRFVLQQITLDALLSRLDAPSNGTNGANCASGNDPPTRDEIMFEAAAVLAGTILMASGTTGNGPGCHNSDVTLSTLLPQIAAYRDQFYEQLLARVEGCHGEKLRAESQRTRQPFGGARQHLNHELARRRAQQMHHVHLAQLYARMGYPEAALEEANGVRIASARMLCQIYCLLTTGHRAIDAHQLDAVARQIPAIEDLVNRGIECGSLVDPWNIVGFGGNFSLFPALENTIHDYRVDDLIDLVEQVLDLCARAWTEAAAVDDSAHERIFSAALERIAAWWDKYATSSVSGIKRLVGKETEVSANLVAGALAAWHKAGAAAGDVKFWRMFVDQFDSPKAFQLVVEALLERGDQVASMALMLQWVSQVEYTPLEDGDASFHPLVLRWLRAVEEQEFNTGTDEWPLVAKFLQHLESSAEVYWHVPTFDLSAELPEGDDDEQDLAEIAASDDDDDDDDDEDEESDELAADLEADADMEDGEIPWEDDEPDELFSAAYEDMIYRDSTDDGFDADVVDEYTDGTEFELEEEAQRIGQRLEFLSTIARLWRHVAIAWKMDATDHPDRCELLEGWCQQALARRDQLLELVEAVHRYPISPPGGSHDSMVEYDRQRMIKDSLLEQIVSTCVETVSAGRLILAASTPADGTNGGECTIDNGASVEILRGVLANDTEHVAKHWPAFTKWLSTQELLYVPLGKGGRPRRIVRARTNGQLLDDLLAWLPRLGLVRETCQLLDIAQSMEIDHPVGPGAVTEYDRLFTVGYQAIVEALVASADGWDESRPVKKKRGQTSRTSDSMLVEALQDLTESQLNRWLAHSRTLRLSVVERLSDDAEWQAFVKFIERYGADLFTQKFLNLGNLRAILHQRTSVWLSNLAQRPDAEDIRLIAELGSAITAEEAAKWLSLSLESIVENYREYKDYNTTTTHSDHGELLHTLIDFLRLRSSYDRVAWNLRPVVMAHEILVRQNRPVAAELWQQALAERTAETADGNLARFEQLCEQYGVRLPSVAERLGERFTRPLAIDRVRALVGPAVAAAETDDTAPMAALQQEIASLAHEPAGAGLDLPDWLVALEEEVSMVRCRRRRHTADDTPRRIKQVRLSWDEWQRQIAEDAT